MPAGDPGVCGRTRVAAIRRSRGSSGVAPRAWIGNYRVFNTPLPLGGCCVANTPEIVAAFEAAVKDGMDIINFSGGGPQIDPRRDALMQAITNTVRAGVLPVSRPATTATSSASAPLARPSTAPEAISVGGGH